MGIDANGAPNENAIDLGAVAEFEERFDAETGQRYIRYVTEQRYQWILVTREAARDFIAAQWPPATGDRSSLNYEKMGTAVKSYAVNYTRVTVGPGPDSEGGWVEVSEGGE